jgi:hypothetical protein
MKKKIKDLISKPSKENQIILKKALKKEIANLNYLRKFPPRYYAYKMMVSYAPVAMFWEDIFNKDLLDQEIEVEEDD